jgi:hypothetical protein
LFVTHCSGKKDPAGGDPLTLYVSDRVGDLGNACNAAGVPWAILSAEYALFFPNEQHDEYDTTLHFRHGQLYVCKQGRCLSPQESEAHVQHLVQAIRASLRGLGVDKVVYYLRGPRGRAVSYLLVMHRALDGCVKGHRGADEVLKCIEAAGRLRIVSGRAGLSASIALHQANRTQGGNDAVIARPLPTEEERAPGRPPWEPRASKGLDGPGRDIEEVWQRIQELEGEKFSQKKGKGFRYSVTGSYLRPSTTNQNLPRRHFEEALSFLPLEGPGQISHLRGPSYIFAILMDGRIRRGDW